MALVLVCALGFTLAGCSSIENMATGEKVDYRSSASTKAPMLDVPPDLTQLARDSRYQTQQGGVVSAAAFQSGTPAAAATPVASTVAVRSVGDVRIERMGNQRWLSTPLTPEQLWPLLQAFWKENGFTLSVDQAASGVMETDWAENRAKLPNDFIRSTIGRVFDSLYSTGERDRFRTRVERSATGTEVYISHRGMIEVYRGQTKDMTGWEARPTDLQLEAEFLSRLLQKLGVKQEQAKAAVADPTAPPARARVLQGQPQAALQIDDNFERAWRRVGLALDRSGFTVEDRDRGQGVYFVRYVDPAMAGREAPGFFAKLFSGDTSEFTGPERYRVAVKGEGENSTVSVLNAQGAPEAGAAGQRIVALLVEELK
ncbi:MAG: lipoprotein [Methylibium sp. NZG]|nr:MAG: lipoprotein [Methylibium sp. NZG]